ncbi:MAG: dienelactone hydrolase family protein [Candidatus Eremiobacteraeota bacterium]|nr:dienelactone hydrolase family protein [Candidatus Eremiobacteraeota bacterium]
MGKTIKFTRPDGKTALGYLAEPSDPRCNRGVVMFEEWWGVDEHMKETADRLASDGFHVLVPDLFGGRIAESREEAGHMVEGLNFGDAATQDAPGAARYLRAHGATTVAVSGFCMGGALALLAVMKTRDFDAVVTWYGLPPPEAGDPAQIGVPAQGHWAMHDEFFKLDNVDDLDRKLTAAGVRHEFHRYDAKHGFYNPGGLGNYNREHAETAWRRMVEFLNRALR